MSRVLNDSSNSYCIVSKPISHQTTQLVPEPPTIFRCSSSSSSSSSSYSNNNNNNENPTTINNTEKSKLLSSEISMDRDNCNKNTTGSIAKMTMDAMDDDHSHEHRENIDPNATTSSFGTSTTTECTDGTDISICTVSASASASASDTNMMTITNQSLIPVNQRSMTTSNVNSTGCYTGGVGVQRTGTPLYSDINQYKTLTTTNDFSTNHQNSYFRSSRSWRRTTGSSSNSTGSIDETKPAIVTTARSTTISTVCLICNVENITDRHVHQTTSLQHLALHRFLYKEQQHQNNMPTNMRLHYLHMLPTIHYIHEETPISTITITSGDANRRCRSTLAVTLCPYRYMTLQYIRQHPCSITLFGYQQRTINSRRRMDGEIQAPLLKNRSVPTSIALQRQQPSLSSPSSSSVPPPPPPPQILPPDRSAAVKTQKLHTEMKPQLSSNVSPQRPNLPQDVSSIIIGNDTQPPAVAHHVVDNTNNNSSEIYRKSSPTNDPNKIRPKPSSTHESINDSWHCHLCQVYHLTSNQFWIHCLTDDHTMKITSMKKKKKQQQINNKMLLDCPSVSDGSNVVVLYPPPPPSEMARRNASSHHHHPLPNVDDHHHGTTTSKGTPTSIAAICNNFTSRVLSSTDHMTDYNSTCSSPATDHEQLGIEFVPQSNISKSRETTQINIATMGTEQSSTESVAAALSVSDSSIIDDRFIKSNDDHDIREMTVQTDCNRGSVMKPYNDAVVAPQKNINDISSPRVDVDTSEAVSSQLTKVDFVIEPIDARTVSAISTHTSSPQVSKTRTMTLQSDDNHYSRSMRGKSLVVGCMAQDLLEECLEEQSVSSNTTMDQDSDSLHKKSDTLEFSPTPIALFDTGFDDLVTPKSSNAAIDKFVDDGTSIFVTQNDGDEHWSCRLCDISNLQGHSADIHCKGKKHRQALERLLRQRQSSMLSPMECVVVARSPRKVLEECLAFQMWIDTTAQTDPRFAYIAYNPLDSDSSSSWSCRLCKPTIHGLKMKDIGPHCLGKKHTLALQNSNPHQTSPAIRFENDLTPIKASHGDSTYKEENEQVMEFDVWRQSGHETMSTLPYSDIDRRLSADMIRSIIEDADPACSHDHRNLSMCSTNTYYYDAMNGEWLDDDGGTIYQSFIDEDSMMMFDLAEDHEANDEEVPQINFMDQQQFVENEEINLSMLVGEDYVDELDTNLEGFCEQLSLELDQMGDLILGRASIPSNRDIINTNEE